jgi:phage FluMu gp28-like protein
MRISKYFYESQRLWIKDNSPLKICVKSRQTGFSWCNCYRLVILVSSRAARLDAFISSRDESQARLQLDDCRHWADLMKIGFADRGEMLFDRATNSSAYVIEFANGRRIYSLSSNPNALAGKRGHVTLDEFALHPDQRLLYRTAKPVTMWGGQLSIISTQRGVNTLFNQIIRSIKEAQKSNGTQASACSRLTSEPACDAAAVPLSPLAEGAQPQTQILADAELPPSPTASSITPVSFGSQWSLHEVPLTKAVDEGIVERINKKTGKNESRQEFLARIRGECIDQEQWLREYCCVPSDESAAFFSYDLLDACTDPSLRLLSLAELLTACSIKNQNSKIQNPLYLGLDVGRHHDLCVIDVGEQIDGAIRDRLRLELQNQTYSQIEAQLYPLLALPELKRACIDQTGIGNQLAERAQERFGWKVEPINFTAPLKEELAFALRRDFEDRKLRIPADEKLRADLRGLKKEVSPSGKLRFIGEVEDSHCDRTWAKALRQHAAR